MIWELYNGTEKIYKKSSAVWYFDALSAYKDALSA